jgi:hypothetical protein
MELKNINTSKFIFDPKAEDFEQSMIAKSEIFNLKKSRKKYLTYITLLYDPQSELRRNNKDYYNRKFECGKLAGFELKEGSFDKEVESTFMGDNDSFNRAVVQYIYYSFNNDYKLLFILEEQYNNAMRDYFKISEFDEKSRKLLTTMKDQIEELETKIFGGTETINTRKALYAGLDSTRERLPRKENELIEFEENGLVDYSPHPGYFPEKLKFIGDKIPS